MKKKDSVPLRKYNVRLNEKKTEAIRKALAKEGLTLSDLFQHLIDVSYEKIKEK